MPSPSLSSLTSRHEHLAPHIIHPPLGTPHTQTLILLHGTSTSGPIFADSFLSFPIPSTRTSHPAPSPQPQTQPSTCSTLPEHFPGVRFVFPSGSLKPVAALGQAGGKKYNAWFDFASFADRTLDEVQQIPGMCESVTYLSKLISDEVELLNQGFIREGMEGGGMGRVVIAGFSQGAAIGLMTLLSGELERLGVGIGERGGFAGFVALSGYLPFRAQICAEILGGGKEKSHDVDNAMKRGKAVLYVRELLGLDAGGVGDRDVGLGSTVIKRGYLDVPIFVAHGEEDVKMKFRWGEEMQDVLIEMGMHVTFESYAGLEHWYCADEMLDFVEFLRGCWHGTEA